MREKIIQNVMEKKLIAIVRGLSQSDCLAVGKALCSGGINMIEVTFDQKSADHFTSTVNAIQLLKETLGEQIYVGAGTVLNKEQVSMAKAAGADYIITPVVNGEVIRYARELEMVAMPGACTPTEIETAYEMGADFVKVFPAGNMGTGYIKAVKAPLSHIPLLAVGGINEKNVAEYLAAGAVGAGIGGNLINREWIAAGMFDKITKLADAYVQAVR